MKKYAWAALFLCLCLLAAGCGKTPAEPNYSDMIVPPLDRSIRDVLPAEAVESVLGEAPSVTELFEDNTCLVHSGDGWRLTLNMQNTTRQGYDALLAGAAGLIPVTDLGEAAHRSEDGSTLIVYAHGYTAEVVLEGTVGPTDAVRRIMDYVLDHIVPTT